MKLTKIREAKFMDMIDALKFQSSRLDDKAFSSNDD
ncbi:hypothetical protein Godav_025037, partial [Gossypium davidsonii]|nr:hypothetical protein [Gossypium davidsonii]MBA0670345.1 hypothetical protein [Gossypium klotzschianum]